MFNYFSFGLYFLELIFFQSGRRSEAEKEMKLKVALRGKVY